MSFPTEEQHAVVVIAALQTGNCVAYDMDDLPAVRPDYYTEVSVTRRYGGEGRSDGYKGTEGYRVTTRVVAKTVSNARTLRANVRASLEYVSLTVGGLATTPVDYETGDPIGPDDGWYSGLETWTYTV